MKKLLASLGLLLLVSGCAVNNNVWYKANSSQEGFAQDRYACLQQAQQPNSTAYYGDYGGLLQSKQYTANAGMVTNNPLFSACMNSKGWSWMDQKAVPGANGAPTPQQANIQSGTAKLAVIGNQMKALCSNPEYAAYYAKAPCSSNETTLAQMADKSKITPSQKAALESATMAFDKLNAESSDILRGGGAKDKQSVQYRESVMNPAQQKNRLDLYDGKINWGDYNRRRKEINDAGTAEQKRIYQ